MGRGGQIFFTLQKVIESPAKDLHMQNWEKMRKMFENEIEMEKIINHDPYPLASLLVTLSKGADPSLFNDWVTYFYLNKGLERPQAYDEAEIIAEHYFGVSRFASYESYKKTIAKCHKLKKGKLLPT